MSIIMKNKLNYKPHNIEPIYIEINIYTVTKY